MVLILLIIPAAAGGPPATRSSSLSSTEAFSPYMILIGDSIAEGHPALHGRLHTGPNGAFTPSHVDQPGQLGFELAERLGLRVINQGIGSQSSKDVRARWARDVFATATDPGDGRGARTLDESGVPPVAVYLHVGINDFSLKLPMLESKANFVYFAETCRKSNVRLIIDNIGADGDTRWLTPEVREAIHEFNHWLATDFLKHHPEVLLIDYCSWSTAGTGDLTRPRAEMFADDVHPNKNGYADFAEFAAKRVGPFLKRTIPPTTHPSTAPAR